MLFQVIQQMVNCIKFIKRKDKGLKLKLLGQKLWISTGLYCTLKLIGKNLNCGDPGPWSSSIILLLITVTVRENAERNYRNNRLCCHHFFMNGISIVGAGTPPTLATPMPGQQSFIRSAGRRQHCVRFDRPEIWTPDLPLQRRKRCRSYKGSIRCWKQFPFIWF